MPRPPHHFVQRIHRLLVLPGLRPRQADVAPRLRLIRRQIQHFFEHRDSQIRPPRLQQAIAQNAQHMAIFQIHFR